jgi:hypothetical protein
MQSYLVGKPMQNFDIDIPIGYLAYAAKIQVGVRTGPSIGIWTVNEVRDEKAWFPSLGDPRVPHPYVSVAGHVILPDKVDTTEVQSPFDDDFTAADQAQAKAGLFQDTVGTVFFTDVLVNNHVAVAVAQDFCLTLSGTIQVFCIRAPVLTRHGNNQHMTVS